MMRSRLRSRKPPFSLFASLLTLTCSRNRWIGRRAARRDDGRSVATPTPTPAARRPHRVCERDEFFLAIRILGRSALAGSPQDGLKLADGLVLHGYVRAI